MSIAETLAVIGCGRRPRIGWLDFNADGKINDADLAVLLANWKKEKPTGGDVNADGKVDDNDLSLLLSQWGKEAFESYVEIMGYGGTRLRMGPVPRETLRPGDMVVYNPFTYSGFSVKGVRGTADNPIIFIADPHGTVNIRQTNGTPAIELADCEHIILDGFDVSSPGTPAKPATPTTPATPAIPPGKAILVDKAQNCIIRNCNIHDSYSGIYGSGDGYKGLGPLWIHNCTIHDNLGSHGIYLGARQIPSVGLRVTDCTIYRNGMHGLQHNGRTKGMIVARNIIHSNKYAAVSFVNGVCDSDVFDNACFNNNHQAIVIYCYDDTILSGIIAYDQTGNVIRENYLWVGKTSWQGDSQSPESMPCIGLEDATAGERCSFAGTRIHHNYGWAYSGWFTFYGDPKGGGIAFHEKAGVTEFDNIFPVAYRHASVAEYARPELFDLRLESQ